MNYEKLNGKSQGCARAAEAEYFVTGDDDLLVPERFGNVRIVKPREFELLFDD